MQPTREIPVEVLPPVPHDVHQPATMGQQPPFAGLKTFYHPASGVVILGIDLLVFGPEMLSGFLDTPLMCVIAFLVTLPLVFLIQKKWTKDNGSTALGKAFLGAVLAGLPFSIAGTMFGAAVLALAGLPHHPAEMLKRLVGGQRLAPPK